MASTPLYKVAPDGTRLGPHLEMLAHLLRNDAEDSDWESDTEPGRVIQAFGDIAYRAARAAVEFSFMPANYDFKNDLYAMVDDISQPVQRIFDIEAEIARLVVGDQDGFF